MSEIGIIIEIGDMGLGFDPYTVSSSRLFVQSQQEKLKNDSSKNDKDNKDEK